MTTRHAEEPACPEAISTTTTKRRRRRATTTADDNYKGIKVSLNTFSAELRDCVSEVKQEEELYDEFAEEKERTFVVGNPQDVAVMMFVSYDGGHFSLQCEGSPQALIVQYTEETHEAFFLFLSGLCLYETSAGGRRIIEFSPIPSVATPIAYLVPDGGYEVY